MANVGQAQANAELILEFLEFVFLVPGSSRVGVLGAGTGQFLDYVPSAAVADYQWTFTDISPRFLRSLEHRIDEMELPGCQFLIENIETSSITIPFHATIVVLVLEHVDLQLAISEIARLTQDWLLVVIQVNPEGMTSNVTPERVIPPSLIEGSKLTKSHLVDKEELCCSLSSRGLRLAKEISKAVLDDKQMLGLIFQMDAAA